MQNRVARGEPLDVKSVASFFLSRIDAKIDPRLDEIAARSGHDPPGSRLRGCTAIASAKLAYETWKDLFAESNTSWRRLSEAGAWPQRLLWASTSTKDPSFDDAKYAEVLIGDRTIITMPQKTLDAFRECGKDGRNAGTGPGTSSTP